MQPTNRRTFLQGTLAAGAAWAAGPHAGGAESAPATAVSPAGPSPQPAESSPQPAGHAIHAAPLDAVRVGLVGAGDRGLYLLRMLLGMEKVEVRAVCDVVQSKVVRAQRLVQERHQPAPAGFWQGPTDYQHLCQRDDLDLVINTTPPPLHAPVCLAALEAGKHVAAEAPLALTVDDCWHLVEAAEKAGRHCALLENYCYQRDVMMVWNMVRRGLFGEVMHVEGGYQRDSRDSVLQLAADGSLVWLGKFRQGRMGNVNPTHDLGPLMQWLDIHHGDRLDYLVSMGGPARSFNLYGAQYFGPTNFLTTTHFDMSDINTCLLRTVKGKTIYLLSDLLLARAQPRNVYRLMGTRGTFDRSTDKIYLEGKSPRRDRWHGEWEPAAKYFEEFDHPWWREMRVRTIGTGQGGGDYLCTERVIQALRQGTPPDIDVYDAAAMSSVIELSERSARDRSRPVDVPDFTRGRWANTPPVAIPGA